MSINNVSDKGSNIGKEHFKGEKKIISIRGVGKSFFGHQILKNISFDLFKGSFCCLLGENGAGKSTLLNILMGQEYADFGDGEILGVAINDDLAKIKNRIGLVTEKVNYDLPIKVGDFFAKYAQFFDFWDETLFRSLMRERNLDLNSSFSNLSRGQKMQVALIAAVVIRPELLLIDEITSVLDIWARKYFMEFLKIFTKEGGTVLITTNIISEIQYACDQVILLNRGEVQLNEKIKEIPTKFIKIRDVGKDAHPIFKDPRCFWSGENSDGTFSYIVPVGVVNTYAIPERLKDRRAMTLDELFIYFIKTGDR